MPQIALKISKNIDITSINFQAAFVAIHEELSKVPNLDIKTCNSGVVQEVYSYIGLGDERITKVYLEVLWLENNQRVELKKSLAEKLMSILETLLVPQIEKQNLVCVPRVRIGNLGVINQDYLISKKQ